MRHIIIACAVLFSLATASAAMAADDDESCVNGLSPQAQEIYRAAKPAMQPNLDLVFVLRAKVGPMVMSGQMSQSDARVAAKAASVCLRLLQNPRQFAQRASQP